MRKRIIIVISAFVMLFAVFHAVRHLQNETGIYAVINGETVTNAEIEQSIKTAAFMAEKGAAVSIPTKYEAAEKIAFGKFSQRKLKELHVYDDPEVLRRLDEYLDSVSLIFESVKSTAKDEASAIISEYLDIAGLTYDEYYQIVVDEMTLSYAMMVYSDREFSGDSEAAKEFLKSEFSKAK